MQCSLLIMCLFWKARQRKLGIDDFGNPLDAPQNLDTALPDGAPVEAAVEDAVESDVRVDVVEDDVDSGETTPLLKSHKDPKSRGWRRLVWWS